MTDNNKTSNLALNVVFFAGVLIGAALFFMFTIGVGIITAVTAL